MISYVGAGPYPPPEVDEDDDDDDDDEGDDDENNDGDVEVSSSEDVLLKTLVSSVVRDVIVVGIRDEVSGSQLSVVVSVDMEVADDRVEVPDVRISVMPSVLVSTVEVEERVGEGEM